MQKISIEQAAAGMILAKPVTNPKGITLCGEGTELTDNLIQRLKAMEITRIAVEGHPVDDGTDEMSPETLHEILEDRFRYVHDSPVLMTVKRIIWKRMREHQESHR